MRNIHTIKNFIYLILFTLLALFTSRYAHAQLRVDISGVGATQYPIAISDFKTDSNNELVQIIRADLTRSGQFQLINTTGTTLAHDAEVQHDNWRNRGADYLVTGSISTMGNQIRVDYKLIDTISKTEIDIQGFADNEKQLRRIAHRIADRIYETITGVRGVFSTRIAYVLQTEQNYELQIADADGANPQVMLRSKQSIISPAWSPDGSKIAYVSFELGKPVIYVQTLATGNRVPIANFKGNNSAPAWSPNGDQLAIVLSKDAISQIYTIDSSGGNLNRIMRSPLIDTEPSYTPDGSSIVFTSDRGGSPQIYKVSSGGGDAERITYNGSYNISPSVSPDGSTLLYVTRQGGNFQIATQNLFSGAQNMLSTGPDDQSPSFAPNGMQVLFSSVHNNQSVLAVMSIDGRVKQTLSALNGKVREPVWGPFTN